MDEFEYFNTVLWIHESDIARELLDLDEDSELHCGVCKKRIEEEYVGVYSGAAYHEACFNKLVGWYKDQAVARARKACKLIRGISEFNGDDEGRHEYSIRCRDECTNYDQLVRDLDEMDVRDGIYRLAIEDRIEHLLDCAGVNGAAGDCCEP